MKDYIFAQLSWPQQLQECRRLLNLSCQVSSRTRRYTIIVQHMNHLHTIHDAQVRAWVSKEAP